MRVFVPRFLFLSSNRKGFVSSRSVLRSVVKSFFKKHLNGFDVAVDGYFYGLSVHVRKVLMAYWALEGHLIVFDMKM